MKKVASISGGKDSTAMLIVLYEEGESLDYVVFMNTGIEFPQTIKFVREKLNPWVKDKFGIDITFIYPEKPFAYYFSRWGVPHIPRGRWCSKHLKQIPSMKWIRDNIDDDNIILYLGYAYDEVGRYKKKGRWVKDFMRRTKKNVDIRAPLIERKITERKALEICKRYDLLNPLYKYFRRVSCWLCPFQPKREWYMLYKHFPQMWRAAKILEKKSVEMGKSTFLYDKTLEELEKEFKGIKTLQEVL